MGTALWSVIASASQIFTGRARLRTVAVGSSRYCTAPWVAAPGAGADQNGARGCQLLQSRRDIDRVAGNQEVTTLRGATSGGNLASIDANAHLQLSGGGIGRPTVGVELAQRALHIECGAHGAHRVVLMGHWQAKDRHNRVADVLLDGAAMPMNLTRHRAEKPREQGARVFGVQVFGERRGAGEVGKEHGDDAPLFRVLFGWRRGARQHQRAVAFPVQSSRVADRVIACREA